MIIQGVSDLVSLLLRRSVDAVEHRGGVVVDWGHYRTCFESFSDIESSFEYIYCCLFFDRVVLCMLTAVLQSSPVVH